MRAAQAADLRRVIQVVYEIFLELIIAPENQPNFINNKVQHPLQEWTLLS